MASIRDVAKLAQVAPSTVSLVLNNKGYVSDASRKKVLDAIKKLNYVPKQPHEIEVTEGIKENLVE